MVQVQILQILWLKVYFDGKKCFFSSNFDENKSGGQEKCFPKMSSNLIRELDLWAKVIILAPNREAEIRAESDQEKQTNKDGSK